MEWSGTKYRKPRLGVRWMLLALVLAAFLGGALGLLWHGSGLSEDDSSPDSAVAASGE